MDKTEIIEGVVAGVLSSGVLVGVIKWSLKARCKPGMKRVIVVTREDGTVLRYETPADQIEDRPEVQKIVEWLHEVETEAEGSGDNITGVSFTLEPLD